MATRYGVEVQSYDMAVMAGFSVHFYGKVWRYNESNEDFVSEREELWHELTASEALELNRIDRDIMIGSFRWKPGMSSNRFESREDVVETGVAYIRENWGHEGPIEVGPNYYDDNPVYGEEG